jgi:hypothetical protein
MIAPRAGPGPLPAALRPFKFRVYSQLPASGCISVGRRQNFKLNRAAAGIGPAGFIIIAKW